MNTTEMTEDDYIALAMRTAKAFPTKKDHLIHAGLGIGSEVGELADALCRELHGLPQEDGHSTFWEAAVVECGDLLWFTALLIDTLHENSTQRDDYQSFTKLLHSSTAPTLEEFSVHARLAVRLHQLDAEYPFLFQHNKRKRAASQALLPIVTQTSGDVLTLIKKECIYGKEVPESEMWKAILELWLAVMAFCAEALEVDFNTVATRNLKKLRDRFPDVYTDEFALARLDTKK